MEEEDNEFFILVLGVLAAIILVISWWFTTGGTAVPSTPAVAPVAEPAEEEDHSDGTEEEQAAPEPTAVPAPEPTAEPEPAEEVVEEAAPAPEPTAPSTVYDAIAANPDLSAINGLLRDNGLDQVLSGDGPFTVFAPTNDAVNTAGASDTTVSVLTANAGNVLTYHVVSGAYSVDDLTSLASVGSGGILSTVQGEDIELTVDDDGNLIINGSTVVAPAGEATDNGVLHTLDNVLVPPVAALNTLVGLDPILFASGSSEIQSESFPTLDRFVEVLGTNSINVDIEGYTDSSGDPILNQNLSESRARSVKNYLVANGIDESRLTAIGFGADNPVADNNTEEGRALNRRIEFSLG